MSATEIVAQLAELGRQIARQDNRATDRPIFTVQEKVRVYGFDCDYSDQWTWINADDFEEASEGMVEVLNELDQNGDAIDQNWIKTGYRDEWKFVTACFTEAGCQQYIDANGHNHGELRIFAAGSYRNREWQRLHDALTAFGGAS